MKGSWFDVGTPKNYLEAMKNLLHGGFSTLNDFGGRLNEETKFGFKAKAAIQRNAAKKSSRK